MVPRVHHIFYVFEQEVCIRELGWVLFSLSLSLSLLFCEFIGQTTGNVNKLHCSIKKKKTNIPHDRLKLEQQRICVVFTFAISRAVFTSVSKTRVFTVANHGTQTVLNRSNLERTTCSWRKVWENLCKRETIWFWFLRPDWMKTWYNFFKEIMRAVDAKSITLDTAMSVQNLFLSSEIKFWIENLTPLCNQIRNTAKT